MLIPLIQFADSSTGIGALGLNLGSFLIQLGTFIIAFLVLRQWAFKPILKVLNERRETIERGVQLGEQMQREKTELEQKVAKSLHDARRQADEIIAAAHEQGRQAVTDAETAARQKAEGIIAVAEDRIKQETTRARKELESELVGLISEATEAIIDEKVDARKDAALIDKVMKERAQA